MTKPLPPTMRSVIADAAEAIGGTCSDIHEAYRSANAEMHRRHKSASKTEDFVAVGQVAQACILLHDAAKIMKAVGKEKS